MFGDVGHEEDRTANGTEGLGTFACSVYDFISGVHLGLVFLSVTRAAWLPRTKTGGLWLMDIGCKWGRLLFRAPGQTDARKFSRTEAVIRWKETCFCFCGANARAANGRRASSARTFDPASVGWWRTTIVRLNRWSAGRGVMCRSLSPSCRLRPLDVRTVWTGGDCWLGRSFLVVVVVCRESVLAGWTTACRARLAYKRREICGRRPWFFTDRQPLAMHLCPPPVSFQGFA